MGKFVPRCEYEFDACVAKAVKMIEKDRPERCPYCYRKNSIPQLEHLVFLNAIFSREFQMKYFLRILKFFMKNSI
jgi:hypothetical protein